MSEGGDEFIGSKVGVLKNQLFQIIISFHNNLTHTIPPSETK